MHIQKWECGGSFFFYCGITKDRKTANGLKKIKCKTPSCFLFELRRKNDVAIGGRLHKNG
jgi:hypothetical protein